MSADPDVIAAVAASNRARALPNFGSLWNQNADFFNQLANLDNLVAGLQNGGLSLAEFRAELNSRAAWLTNFMGAAPAAALSPSQLRPDLAAAVKGFYQTYLHREFDQAGLDFWVQNAITNGIVATEHGFQVQATNDAATNAQAQADEARAAQQAAEARVAELTASIAALNAQIAAGGTAADTAALRTQITTLQAQLAAARTAAAAAGSAADTHEANANLLSQIGTYASGHKLIVGAVAIGALFMFGGFGSTGKKR